MPNKDAVLLNVSQIASTQWTAYSFMALLWKTQADLASDVSAFENQLQQHNTAGSKRSQQTKTLEIWMLKQKMLWHM